MEIKYSTWSKRSYGSSKEHLISVKLSEFNHDIIRLDSDRRYHATSVVRRRFLRPPLHVLLLDCDGTAEMLAAVASLNCFGVGYATIQSSPGRYWLVVDKIGTYRELRHFAAAIPGVDPGYVTATLRHRRFFLRLTPRADKVFFSGPGSLATPAALNWYTSFETIWNSQPALQRQRSELLTKQLNDGSLLSAAADPTFML